VKARRRSTARRKVQLHFPEERVPADHPLRPIRKMVDEILREMSPQFAKLHSNVGVRRLPRSG
jgi:hypothetical protein